jgi:hypothetical protein
MKKIMFCLLAIFLLHGSALGSFNFIDNGNGTVTDVRTGLVWLKSAHQPGYYQQWNAAHSYCASLASGMAGLTDGSTPGQWRMPTIEELKGLGTDPPGHGIWTMPGSPFTDVMSHYYWSGSLIDSGEYANDAWYLYMKDGGTNHAAQNYYAFDVWPVRGPNSDIDTDGDGVFDDIDNCRYVYNPDQKRTCSNVSEGDACLTDTDGDGIPDACDNCPDVYNPNQSDADTDGEGDACDHHYLRAALQECQAELQTCLNPPTNISLSSLKAIPSDKQVIFKWKTETETGNAGFNVWRADNFVKINNALIPALGSSIQGAEYDFVDEWVLNGKRYFYLLEDIDTDGISTFHGPVKAVPSWIYGSSK